MDNGAAPPGRGRSRAGTKSRPSEPADPRAEPVERTEPAGNGRTTTDPTEPVNGAGTRAPGAKSKRRLAAAALLRPRGPVIDAPDATSPRGDETDATARPAPPADAAAPLPTIAPPSTAVPVTTGSAERITAAGSGPALLPPIRTDGPSTHGDPAPVAAGSRTSTAPAAPNVAPATPIAIVAPAGKTMPFVRAPAPPEVVPGELVALKVAAPPAPVELDVPLDPEQTGEQPAVGRVGRPSITFQRRRTRARVRRVTRVVRHIDTWSVFKVALVFSAFLYAVTLTAGVLLWHVAIATGTVDNVERFFEGFGWQTFKFKGGEIFHNAWIAGLFGAVGLTGFAVLVATMFNLITDLVGGIRVSVLEEEVLARRDRTATVVVEDDPDETTPYDQARSG